MLYFPRHPTDMLALLRGVSRSFYLSIRVLPAALRRPIAVAYLLARACDTLADTAELPSGQRLAMLDELAGVIDGRGGGRALPAMADSFTPLQHDAQEHRLIVALPQCLHWLDELAPADRDDVRAVLRHITRGQALDIQRFASGTPQALNTPAQLDEYTYLVAGCVGEFWTTLCLRHLRDFATLPPEQMRELGRRFGMSLQLVNILRDAGADLEAGRCYFPADQLAAAGLSPAHIRHQPDRFEPVWSHWHAQAAGGLALGMRYADAVNNRRVRAASAMPALLAARTLELLRVAGPQRLHRKLKMPRQEVHAMMARMALTLAGRRSLQSMYGRMGAGQPAGEWDNRQP